MQSGYKILYVSPFAHYVGHYPYVTSVEPRMLQDSGVDVEVLTYAGITGNPDMGLPCFLVKANNSRLLSFIRRFTIGRWVLMFFEVWATLRVAIKIAEKEKRVIHLRDGDLYMLLHHLLALPYKNISWCISMTGGMLYPPKLGGQTNLRGNLALLLYWLGVKVLMGNWLKPLYAISIKRNNYRYFTQNEVVKKRLDGFCNGVFKGLTRYIPLPCPQVRIMDKSRARKVLGLPLDKTVILSFGSWHSGKDMECVFRAMAKLGDDVHYLCAGR